MTFLALKPYVMLILFNFTFSININNVNEGMQIEITEMLWHLKLDKMKLECQASTHI